MTMPTLMRSWRFWHVPRRYVPHYIRRWWVLQRSESRHFHKPVALVHCVHDDCWPGHHHRAVLALLLLPLVGVREAVRVVLGSHRARQSWGRSPSQLCESRAREAGVVAVHVSIGRRPSVCFVGLVLQQVMTRRGVWGDCRDLKATPFGWKGDGSDGQTYVKT
jgi:hypothetical protein